MLGIKNREFLMIEKCIEKMLTYHSRYYRLLLTHKNPVISPSENPFLEK